LNGVWLATTLGVVCARYRDVQQVVAIFLQISMFVTPIFFTPEQLGPRFQHLVEFNVLYHLVDIVRSPLLGRAPAAWSWTVTIGTLVLGWLVTLWIYSRLRRRVPYWL
jgi:lipopolysaccharide transport system permease protein